MKNHGCHLPHTNNCPQPAELWSQAKSDNAEYLELMRVHGHVVRSEPCPTCGQSFRHRHEGIEVIKVNAFGHDERNGHA